MLGVAQKVSEDSHIENEQGIIYGLIMIMRHLYRALLHFKYSGIRIKSTPRDRKKLLTLSKVDFIQFQGRKTKYY